MAQTIYNIVEKLNSAGLITAYEKKQFLKDRKAQENQWKKLNVEGKNENWEEEINDEPHYPLVILMQLKMYSTPGTLSFIFTPAEIKIKKGEEKKLTDELKKYINKVHKANLISDQTLQEIMPHIQNLELRSEYEVTASASERTEKEYFLKPERLKKFADQLFLKDLISKDDYTTLINRSYAKELRDYIDVWRYMKNLVIINTKDYSGLPENYLERLYRKSATVFPNLEFDSFQFFIEQDKKVSTPDFQAYNMKVSISKDKKSYHYRSYFDADYKNKKEDVLKIPERYYEIFNKLLADQGSDYRLHMVSFNKDHFGIVALTKKQFDGLLWSYSGMYNGGYLNLSYENFTNKLTQEKINTSIKVYDSIGLLSHLTAEEKDSCIKEILGKEINYYSDILSSFKNLVFEIDLEYGVNSNQYKEITENISLISKGNFLPTDIIDTYNYEKNKRFDYGFTLKGKTYKTKLFQEDDWLNPNFWELITKAIEEQDRNGKFYDLHPNDGMRQIYLTNEQYKILTNKKLIELKEEDMEN